MSCIETEWVSNLSKDWLTPSFILYPLRNKYSFKCRGCKPCFALAVVYATHRKSLYHRVSHRELHSFSSISDLNTVTRTLALQGQSLSSAPSQVFQWTTSRLLWKEQNVQQRAVTCTDKRCFYATKDLAFAHSTATRSSCSTNLMPKQQFRFYVVLKALAFKMWTMLEVVRLAEDCWV